MSAPSSAVNVARTSDGACVRIEGRGTMRESPAVMDFATRTLEAGAAAVVIDLTGCDYLDSTFLGCILGLHKRFGAARPPRLLVASSAQTSRKLFGPTRLDKLLNITPAPPPVVGAWQALAPAGMKPKDLTRHGMECHRRLAEVEGPAQAAFQRIAEGLARDLEAQEKKGGV